MEDFGGLTWMGSGFLTYVGLIISDARASDDFSFTRDVAENPSAGQAFFLAVILGPVFTLILFFALTDSKINEEIDDSECECECEDCREYRC